MSQGPDQLTRRPICPVCKKVQLTDEEVARAADPTKRRCWYCLAESLISMGAESSIPDPMESGRKMTKEEGIEQAKARNAKILRASPSDIISAITEASNEQGAQEVTIQDVAGSKPVLTPTSQHVQLSDAERAQFITAFGMDPMPKDIPYEIVVYGATESTYLKFGFAVPIDLNEQRELQRIMGGVLEIFGKFLKYGAQFTAALLELQALASEMFLGRR